ncbi:hypothetical protein PBRA_009643 [Plasmodiophora brassicae]|uniref:Uncharacterized protein n=1 Tax=Plasmodiophora brassicae TaxID=37360 RepID=A0A0G4IJW5_PLABS|nr:hypothetical protein PBRA_009643 [Plasmodiophora brassicae]
MTGSRPAGGSWRRDCQCTGPPASRMMWPERDRRVSGSDAQSASAYAIRRSSGWRSYRMPCVMVPARYLRTRCPARQCWMPGFEENWASTFVMYAMSGRHRWASHVRQPISLR